MKIFEGWKNIIEKIQNMSKKDFNAWMSIFMILICADLFGVYWYLNLKKLGIALLMVFVIMFTFLLFFSKKKVQSSKQTQGGKNKMPEEEKTDKDQDEKKDEEKDDEPTEKDEESSSLDFDIGLGDADERQKRLDNALGKPLF